MKFNILGRGWKLKIYRGYENIQNVRNTRGSKMLLIPIFTCFLWTHPLRSKPIIKRPFKCLKRSFGFQFQASSSICEQLMRAYPRSKKICIHRWFGDYCILGRIWVKRGFSKQVWFFPKTDGGWGSNSGKTPEKLILI